MLVEKDVARAGDTQEELQKESRLQNKDRTNYRTTTLMQLLGRLNVVGHHCHSAPPPLRLPCPVTHPSNPAASSKTGSLVEQEEEVPWNFGWAETE